MLEDIMRRGIKQRIRSVTLLPSLQRGLRTLGIALVVAQAFGASCASTVGQRILGLMPGVVNDPGNLSLRRAILAFGTEQICAEMLARSAPLRLTADQPVIGRFFPTSCSSQALDNGNLFIQFGGFGYAWTSITQRMGFDAGGAIEFRHDFLMHRDDMYVYFQQQALTASSFRIRMVENAMAAAASKLPIPLVGGGNTVQSIAEQFGQQLLRGEMSRGFTVVRHPDGSARFGLGLVERGSLPAAPYERSAFGVELYNDVSEVSAEEQDFVGPIRMPKGGDIRVRASTDGVDATDLLLTAQPVQAPLPDPWLDNYLNVARLQPPLTPPAVSLTIPRGQPLDRVFRLGPGNYFLVLDHSSTVGSARPVDGRAAAVRYSVELKD